MDACPDPVEACADPFEACPDPPEDWPNRVFDWLWQHNDRELENRDDRGAYPSTDSVREALAELGLLDSDN